MQEYSNLNKGVLFAELDKKTEKSPDYTGKIDINGKEMRLAGWKRQSKNGTTFLSLAVSEFTETQKDTVAPVTDGISLSDIPF